MNLQNKKNWLQTSSRIKKLIIIFSILAIAGGFVLAVNKYNTDKTIGNEPKLVFEEIRQWQIASDAPVIEAGDVTSSSGATTGEPYIGYSAYVAGDLIIMFMTCDDDDAITPATTGPNGETRTIIGSGDSGHRDSPGVAGMWFVGTEARSAGTQMWTIYKDEEWIGKVIKVPAGEFDSSNPIDSVSGIGGADPASTNVPTPSWSTSTADGRVVVFCGVNVEPFSSAATGWTEVSTTPLSPMSGTVTIRDAATTTSETIATANHLIATADVSSTLGCVVNAPVAVSPDFSGRIFTNEGTTGLDCTTSRTVSLKVNGTGADTVECSNSPSNGSFSFTGVSASAGDIVTVYIDGESEKAVTVTESDGNNLTGLDLYTNHVIARHDNGGVLTIDDMDNYDKGNNENVFFTATSGTPDTLVVDDGQEFYVLTGDTFTPGGNVTVDDIKIVGTYTATGSESITVSGSWVNSGTFTAASSTVTFDAISGTESIDSTGATVAGFNALTFGLGSGTANWTLGSTLDISGNLSIDYGTLTQNGTNNVNITGALSIGASGNFGKVSGSTMVFNSGTTQNLTSSGNDLGNIQISTASTHIDIQDSLIVDNVTIDSSATLDSNNNSIDVGGNWVNSGSFAAGTGTVTFSATTGTPIINPGASAFNSVVFNDAGGSATFRPTVNMTVNADFTLTDGALDLNTNNPTMIFGDDIGTGNFKINGGSITPSLTADFVLNDNPTIFYAVAGVTLGEVVIGQSPADTILTSDMSANTITVSAGDGLYTCRYDLDAGNGGIQISGVLDTSASGDGKCSGNDTDATYMNTANDFNLSSTATFVQDESTVEFDDGAGTNTLITDGAFSLYNLVIDGGTGIIIQVQDPLDVDNDVTITNGALDTVSGENNQITVGGSWSNADEFTARSGLVLFDSGDTGETIDSGGTGSTKDFYDIQFNNSDGGWTIQTNNLTATHNFTITDTAASGFTVNSVTTEVQGTYSIADAETSNTTWTSATLYLNSGTAYTVGSKAQNAEAYATLQIGANTDIRMWESSAATAYTVDASGSLYSQDHANVAGDLYIWGDYHVNTNDYWSYANDFDNAASARQVDVRIDPAAKVTVDSGDTLAAVGVSGNRTTISRQGTSNGYEISCLSGGTIDFQHTDFDYLDGALGIDIQGGSTVTSLDNTDFDNLVGTAGTADAFITVASTVIGSGSKTITGVNFDNTGTGAEFNVNRTGANDTGHWDFDTSTGAFDGEANDGDDGVNEADPGMLQWDDSSSGITIDGFIYSDEGSTAYLCSTTGNLTIDARVNGAGSYTAECVANTGAFSIANVTISNASDVVTIFVNENGSGSVYATTVTKAADTTSGITADLYQNHVIIRHEDGGPMTIDNLNSFDFVNDNDIQFTADDSTPDLLTVNDGHELYILGGDTFTPGGNVTVDDIKIPGIYTATGSESITVSGSWVNSGTFTAATSTVTFDATSDTKAINSTGASTATFNNLVLGTGSGTATWDLGSALDVDGNLTIDYGTLGQGANNITLEGNLSIGASGNFTSGSGTFTFDGTTTPVTWNNAATIDDLGTVVIDGTTKTVNLISSVQATSITVGADDILGLASSGYTLTISGSGTAGSRPFIVNNASGLGEGTSSTVKFTGTSATEIEEETYYHLELAPTAGSPTYTLGTAASQTVTTSGNFTVGNGSDAVTVSAVTNDPNISIIGNAIVSAGATFTNSDLATATLNIDGNLTINNTGTFTSPIGTAAASFTLAGNFSNSGTFNNNSGTATFDGSGSHTIADGGDAFYNITFNGSGSWLYQDGAVALPNQTTVQAGTLTYFNAKTGPVSVTGGILNVDWYAGVHTVNAADTLINIDTGCSDITISEANSALMVWRYNSGWGASAASQTTGTGAACNGPSNGINAQITNTGAIRVREYSMTVSATCPGAGCTLYKYNLDVAWQSSYGQYNYYDDYGENYLTSCLAGTTSACSDDATDDDTIGVGWYRSSAGTINGSKEYDGVNNPPTQGSWYVGMIVGLDVAISGTDITFANLNSGNSFTNTAATKTKITVSTSATNGYIVTAWETKKMTHNDFPAVNIINWPGNYTTPTAWGGTCIGSGQCGFGFTSSDADVESANRYNNGTAFAGFSEDSSSPIRVMDYGGPISGEDYDITYRISALDTQRPGAYSTTIVYVITAEY
ncbi:MAG: hypothetical protein KAI71_02010 [Candidatus Pacebacteria bacterium]|nr:hypothetical protein [Candidatus Paceibacterota bacterium]